MEEEKEERRATLSHPSHAHPLQATPTHSKPHPPAKPSCLQMTVASRISQLKSQMVPQRLLTLISTRPLVEDVPLTSRTGIAKSLAVQTTPAYRLRLQVVKPQLLAWQSLRKRSVPLQRTLPSQMRCLLGTGVFVCVCVFWDKLCNIEGERREGQEEEEGEEKERERERGRGERER